MDKNIRYNSNLISYSHMRGDNGELTSSAETLKLKMP